MAGRYSNGLTTLFGKMEPNQAIFVHHLRANPHGVTQITGALVDDSKNMCALGLGLEAFGMIKAYEEEQARPSYSLDSKTHFDPYKWIAAHLNMPKKHVEQIYVLNDDENLTFGEIADILERYFSAGNLFGWDTKGPEELYAEGKRAKTDAKRQEFVALWATFADKHEALLKEAAAAFGVTTLDLRADGVFETWDAGDFFDDVVNEDGEY